MPELLTPAGRRACLGASPWFADLPIDLAAWIANIASPVALSAGQLLFSVGDPPDGAYVVIDGALRIASSSAEGKEALLMFVEPPQWLGESGLFDGSPRSQDAWAERDCTLLHLRQADLLDHLTRHPHHWRSFGLLQAQKLRLALRAMADNALSPPQARLARRLVAMAYGFRGWSGASKRVIEVQQDDLGAMLSISRQTINQLLKNFESRGFLRRGRGTIEILDMPRLKQFATDSGHPPAGGR